MTPISGWHPLVVHFPLALIVTAAACLTLASLRRVERHAAALATVGSWNLAIGTACVLLALGTGLAAAAGLEIGPAARLAIVAHVKSAILTTLLLLAAALWRTVGVPAATRPSALFVVLLWVATASAIVTGYRGAQNVYRYGIGVSASPTTKAGE